MIKYLKDNWRKMVPFALVGGIFNLIELGGPFFFVKYYEFPVQITYTVCFITATIVAYILNTYITFRSKFNLSNFLRYFFIYMGALLIGKIVIFFLMNFTSLPHEFLHFFPAPLVYIWNFFLTNRYLVR